ncbi:MAG: hypothetical protein IBX43_05190 [Campylobacterales bacterium]|nr:hypothetical protein [Campylobacterales bacterium]
MKRAAAVMLTALLFTATLNADKLYSQLTVGPVGSQVLQIADCIVRIEAGRNIVLDAIRF